MEKTTLTEEKELLDRLESKLQLVRDRVQADQTVLYATLETVPTQRREPTGFTTVSLAEQGSGKPVVLLKWFYPGNLTGHEFVYSQQQEKELAQNMQRTIAANRQTKANSESTGVGN